MIYLIAIVLIVVLIGLSNETKTGGGSSLSKSDILIKTKVKLKKMFDHQISYKTVNGSWLSVSFNHMNLFDKDGIWQTLRKGLGEKQATTLHPQTYILPAELHRVMELPDGHSFILKKITGPNSWGRKGLKIVDSRHDVAQNASDYDIVQILIPNPHLINGFKYDIRMFLVVHHIYGVMLYREGYFSYSNHKYNPKSSNMFARIGGVHLTPEFYISNKLPMKGSDYKKYALLYPKIKQTLTKIFDQYPKDLLTSKEKSNGLIKIFGIDINIFIRNSDYLPILIEMNSNPALLFPEASWKTQVIYNMVTAIEDGNTAQFSILRPISQ